MPPAASASPSSPSAPPANPASPSSPSTSARPNAPARADLVITGEGAFDFSSRSGKVLHGVAEIAADALRPVHRARGPVLVGSREMRALGIESAYSLVDLVGEERAFADPAGSLADLAQRTARTWSR
ncbi:glycerate kinase [Nocardioides sp. B-3]|uniref:glycerate kinase n=1 Tax=Nocardioides sp. B-3 TaxID=2895565 RepID=UPI0021530667|nr:glycerate kinase [Nocardioides sp. B-3]UUZ61859.1 glycerate kinase [Nocardioides sp. B-3]